METKFPAGHMELHETHRRNVLLADLLMAARVDSHLIFPCEVQMETYQQCHAVKMSSPAHA